ncbi:MAG: DUF4097 family beta strand repeat protein [Bacteroidetes bacterium]|nr:DUF4097 family beta strand repeat protein [Bacteroidota bacterium]
MKTSLTLLAFGLASVTFAQKDPNEFHLDKEYKISANGTLRLTASDAHVIIHGSSRQTARVRIDRVVTKKGWIFNEHPFDVEINENEDGLTIKEKPHSISGVIGFYSEKYTIEIDVPASVSVDVHGDDGKYKVDHINGAASFRLDDADITLTDCEGADFYFNVDDGRVTMNGGRGKLEVKGDDAHITISNGAFNSISTSTDDGDLSIETSLAEGGNYRINAEDGSVAFVVTSGGGKFDVYHDDGKVTADSKFVAVKETDERKQFSLANGNANVDIHADDARVKLQTK